MQTQNLYIQSSYMLYKEESKMNDETVQEEKPEESEESEKSEESEESKE